MRQIQDIKAIDFSKEDGLVPAIIQDNNTGKVLMLGYMNEAALEQTLDSGKVTFFSRSKQRLWTKGETSENFLNLVSISPDCDQDALLVKVNPEGPTCHLGDDTCWEESNENNLQFLGHLTEVIKERRQKSPEESYVARLFSKGINKVAQKVGEEAVEVVIEAKDSDDNLFLNESADLLFHYMMLLEAKGFTLNDVISVLKERHK
ncbi:bifunctional phosphoribosyl-AMP cyclohydrolase/phosphoribosyl-ATP diphosphatase [Roseivirga spongicola]|uniref:Histidine biosynthesis bifunctional protein HisIE n=1 Tax=Roseivirga spongicola TaxID=333140 RepID=A0A150X5M5_9BACT|nr:MULTISPECIES: bifunctional phosphoribosyl-AMP cyclohydrolase/phosphoribosyl-ATP diphosphatase HisIE [Roseivirga]KYG74045.1 bifunctional phosphoribosyl-AMP cyclohydrolase/phosphoribosyl-ATP diphosphatase [Roseivirga spongicola]MBO6660353.1 bifunctional phosphoribosyl-AMP cyclohydrolase/phosphoribosyl-ATP diphosphatase HisIE [Roseivirga sp.]MBO6906910.1 bifunctional phosphoribosyl-AMP cyclohydrolase/phosphoribosyl-ATP diphosphatase HisIE [Roseivirga sp.]